MDLPAAGSQILLRQQRPLDAGGQLQVVLQRSLLLRREAAQAVLDQRICEKEVVIDRFLADLAGASAPVADQVA